MLQYAGPVFLIGLLLVPLVVSGHHHAGSSQKACAACVVTHHTPGVSTPGVAVPQRSPLVVGVEPVDSAAPTELARRQATVRGPPVALLLQGA